MENLYAFLLGIAFPVGTMTVSVLMIASGAKQGEPAKAMAFLTLIGLVVWVVIFAEWGIAAGWIAFGGWVVGFGIAAVIMAVIYKVQRRKRAQRNPFL